MDSDGAGPAQQRPGIYAPRRHLPQQSASRRRTYEKQTTSKAAASTFLHLACHGGSRVLGVGAPHGGRSPAPEEADVRPARRVRRPRVPPPHHRRRRHPAYAGGRHPEAPLRLRRRRPRPLHRPRQCSHPRRRLFLPVRLSPRRTHPRGNGGQRTLLRALRVQERHSLHAASESSLWRSQRRGEREGGGEGQGARWGRLRAQLPGHHACTLQNGHRRQDLGVLGEGGRLRPQWRWRGVSGLRVLNLLAWYVTTAECAYPLLCATPLSLDPST